MFLENGNAPMHCFTVIEEWCKQSHVAADTIKLFLPAYEKCMSRNFTAAVETRNNSRLDI